MHNIYFYVITGILVFDFLLERWLEYLNTRAWSPELPEVLRGIYDPGKYRLSQEYYLANLRFGVVSSVFSFLDGMRNPWVSPTVEEACRNTVRKAERRNGN
jgi:hypothetical protein